MEVVNLGFTGTTGLPIKSDIVVKSLVISGRWSTKKALLSCKAHHCYNTPKAEQKSTQGGGG